VQLNRRKGAKVRISVFGLGYVGTVCAGCLGTTGHTVVGVDINQAKVDLINSGSSPIVEPGVDDLIGQAHREKKLWATTSVANAIASSDVSLICVGTPSRANGSLDLTYVKRVCEEIGQALRGKNSYHLVNLRSTMLPGTTEEVAIPTIEACASRKIGQSLGVCYNPEFLREGSSVRDFFNPPKIVIGENDKASGDVAIQLYQGVKAPLIRTSVRVAEMVKYTDNAFHALKITFANEIGNVCKGLGVDSHQVMAIFCEDTKLNLSPAYLKPGFAFGGSCLPKDLRALTHRAKTLDLETPVLNAILRSNAHQILLGLQKITQLRKKRIGFLGMSFKTNTDDLRESPLVEVIETLIGKGYSVRIYDRNVSINNLVGANKRYIDEHVPHLSCLLVDTVDQLLDHAEVVVLGHHSEEVDTILKKIREDQTVVDLVAAARTTDGQVNYEGICW
jgi:GDP-mannose 6-dehydrogenase